MRAALVTGASTGVGMGIARRLGELGYGVTMTSRRADRLASAERVLAGEGLRVRSAAIDVRDSDAVRALVTGHEAAFGRLDVLVNSAGLGVNSPVDALSDKHIALQLDVNVGALVVLYREAVALLRAAGREHRRALVVNLASATAWRAEPDQALYASTKAAIVAFTRAMNEELGGDGIKSTALCPGYVDTEMTTFLRDRVPQAEMLPVGDIADAVEWLLGLSPQCVVPELPLMRPGAIV